MGPRLPQGVPVCGLASDPRIHLGGPRPPGATCLQAPRTATTPLPPHTRASALRRCHREGAREPRRQPRARPDHRALPQQLNYAFNAVAPLVASQLLPGGSFHVHAQVSDDGTRSAPTSQVGVYLSSDTRYSVDDRKIGVFTQPATRFALSLVESLSMPADVAPGQYELMLR